MNDSVTQLGAAMMRHDELIIIPSLLTCTGDEVKVGGMSLARRDDVGMLWVRFPQGYEHRLTTGRIRMNALLRGMRLTHRYRFSLTKHYTAWVPGFSWRTHHSRNWTHRHGIPIGVWLPVAEGDLGALAVAAMMPAILNHQSLQ